MSRGIGCKFLLFLFVISTHSTDEDFISINETDLGLDRNGSFNSQDAPGIFLESPAILENIPAIPLDQPYVAKCCQLNQVLDADLTSCIDKPSNISTNILDAINEENISEVKIRIREPWNNCRGGKWEIHSPENLTLDGRFMNSEGNHQWYGCSDYRLTGSRSLQLTTLTCSDKSDCLGDACIEKCCPFGQRVRGYNCVDITEEDDITGLYFSLHHLNRSHVKNWQELDIRLRTTFMQDFHNNDTRLSQDGQVCIDLFELWEGYGDQYYLLNNGSLLHIDYEVTDIYCTDYGYRENTIFIKTFRCIHEVIDQETKVDSDRNIKIVYTALLVISLLALIVTLIVYLIVPDLGNLHGKIVISNVVSMSLTTVFLLCTYNIPFESVHPLYCTVSGYVGYFCIMSMITWMTAMCVDLCWTFVRAKVPSKSSEKFKFGIYSLISWGTAAGLTCLLFCLQKFLPVNSVFNPLIGYHPGECFVSRADNRMLLHFHLPLIILMVTNITLFMVIIVTIYRSKDKTKNARAVSRKRSDKEEDSRVNRNTREQLKLYSKLLLVLGLLWFWDTVHYFCHIYNTTPIQLAEIDVGNGQNSTAMMNPNVVFAVTSHFASHEARKNIVLFFEKCSLASALEIIFKIFDSLNLLRGVFFFLIFVCKKSVYRKILKQRRPAHGPGRGQSKMSAQSSRYAASRTTSTSVGRTLSNMTMNSIRRILRMSNKHGTSDPSKEADNPTELRNKHQNGSDSIEMKESGQKAPNDSIVRVVRAEEEKDENGPDSIRVC